MQSAVHAHYTDSKPASVQYLTVFEIFISLLYAQAIGALSMNSNSARACTRRRPRPASCMCCRSAVYQTSGVCSVTALVVHGHHMTVYETAAVACCLGDVAQREHNKEPL